MRAVIVLSAAALLLPCMAPLLFGQGGPSGLPFSPAVAAGDFVYLSGMLATGNDGVLVTGDVRVQTATVLSNLAALLERNGSRLEQVASVTIYLKNAADFAAMNEVYAKTFAKDPPARTTVVTNLVLPDALVEISAVALRNSVERQVVHPAGWLHSPNPYSYGIRSGNTLFLSGIVSRNGKDNSVVTGNASTQTRQVLQNAREILESAGMSLADVVSSRVYVTDTSIYQDMNAVYREAFPNVPPARATVRCGLTGNDYLVEITMTAVKDASRRAVSAPAPAAPATAPRDRAAVGAAAPPLSRAIAVGGRLFLSGMLGDASAHPGDTAAQTRDALEDIGATLKSAGFSWGDVVDATVYLTDLASFAAMNGAYRERFTGTLPARATVQAGLVRAGASVEIMMTAVKGGGK